MLFHFGGSHSTRATVSNRRIRLEKTKRSMALTMAFLMLMTTVMTLAPAVAFATDILALEGSLESSATPTSAPSKDLAPIAPALADVAPTSESTLEVGKTYLVDVASRNINDPSSPSPTAVYTYSQAVVEVKGSGATVSFFQTSNATDITNYLYDSAQSDATNDSSEGTLVPAIEALNGDSSVKRITVEWPDLTKSLYIKMTVPQGTPESGITGPSRARLVLNLSTAALMTAAPFTGFGTTEPAPIVNKDALGEAIEAAEALDLGLYTTASAATVTAALAAARSVYADGAATQEQVNSAHGVLIATINGLELIPVAPPELEVGKTYIATIYSRDINNLSANSPTAPYMSNVAIVEVKASGATVSYFQIDGVPYITDYLYDPAQSDTTATTSESGLAASIEKLNADETVKRITVEWPDVSRSLYTKMTVPMGEIGSGIVGPSRARMVLNLVGATELTGTTYLGFTFPAVDDTLPPVVDKSALQAKIAEAQLKSLIGYTDMSVAEFNAALADAIAVNANSSATQSAVDEALSRLSSALTGLTLKGNAGELQVGKTYLVSISAKLADMSGPSSAAGYYDKKAVVEVLASGYIVSYFQTSSLQWGTPNQYDASQSDSNTTAWASRIPAYEAINAANTARVIKVNWQDINRSLYVTMVDGMSVERPMRMVLDVSSAVEMTASSYLGFGYFVSDVSRTDLVNLVNTAKTKKSADHTPVSFKALTDALADAEAVLANPSASAAQINAAYKALKLALDGLKAPANKTALQNLVTSASAKKKADYTEASFAALTKEIKAAQAVLKDPNASQEAVNLAKANLQKALDNLAKKPAGPTVNKENMTTGRYTVQVDFWHQDKTGPSNANPSLNHTAIIDVAANGAMTMSISTKPIKVGSIVAVLRALDINGSPTSVIANNITLNGQSYASAFSFPLPNKEMYHPAVFHLTANPGPSDPPGWLRIGWETLQAAPGAGLSTDTTVANATRSQAELDKVERTNKKTDKEAAKPKMSVAGAATTDDTGAIAEATGLGGVLDNITQSAENASWLTWVLVGLGILSVFGLGWIMGNRRAVPQPVATPETALIVDEPETEPVIEAEEDRRVYDSTAYKQDRG